jgi:hypothetical protein
MGLLLLLLFNQIYDSNRNNNNRSISSDNRAELSIKSSILSMTNGII